MTTLQAHLEKIAAGLAVMFPDARSVEVHRGRFSLAELKRMGARLPALRAALGRVIGVAERGDGQLEAACEFWITAITRDFRGLPRHEGAVNMVDALILGLPGERFGAAAFGAEDITAANLFTGDVDDFGVMMWEVRFRQRLWIGAGILDADGALPRDLYLGLAPEIGAEHREDYRHTETGAAPPPEDA